MHYILFDRFLYGIVDILDSIESLFFAKKNGVNDIFQRMPLFFIFFKTRYQIMLFCKKPSYIYLRLRLRRFRWPGQ